MEEWDRALKGTGFSAVKTSSTPSFCSVILSQAVEETFKALREPLSVDSRLAGKPLGQVLVVSDVVSKLVSRSQPLLSSIESVTQCDLVGLEDIQCPVGVTMLCLCDLDSPVFGDVNEARFWSMQFVFCNASTVLSVVSGATSGQNQLATVTVGLGCTLLAEHRDLRLQFLGVANPKSLEPSLLANLLLRLTVTGQPNQSEIL